MGANSPLAKQLPFLLLFLLLSWQTYNLAVVDGDKSAASHTVARLKDAARVAGKRAAVVYATHLAG
jgi:hypothetical protein